MLGVKKSLVKKLSVIGILLYSGILLAQNSGTPSQIRVLTDANNYLLVAAGAQTLPISNPTTFTNTRLRTNSSGYLQVVLQGGIPSSSFPLLAPTGCTTVEYSFTGRTTTGMCSSAADTATLVAGGTTSATFTTTGINAVTGTLTFGSNALTRLIEDGNYILAQRNGTNAQVLRVYNTYTSSTNNERFGIDWQTTSNVAFVGTRTATTGTSRNLFLSVQQTNGANSYGGLVIQRSAVPFISMGLFTASFGVDGTGATGNMFQVGTLSQIATSGQVNILAITPTYNQTTGTASNTDLLINRTETAIGSGSQRFIDLQVGGTSRLSFNTSGYLQGTEQSAPAAPAADGYRLFSQDNGAGKTQLCVIFSSGAAQCFATQP